MKSHNIPLHAKGTTAPTPKETLRRRGPVPRPKGGRETRPRRPPPAAGKEKAPAPVRSRGQGKRFAPRYFHALLNALSSPRGALTAVFGMGTGVSPPPMARTKGVGDRPSTKLLPGTWPPGSSSAPGCPRGQGGADGVQTSRPIRSGMLNASRRLHIRPVDGWSSRGLQGLAPGTDNLRGGLALRCLQRLSRRDVATRRCRWLDNRNTRGRPPPVLSY